MTVEQFECFEQERARRQSQRTWHTWLCSLKKDDLVRAIVRIEKKKEKEREAALPVRPKPAEVSKKLPAPPVKTTLQSKLPSPKIHSLALRSNRRRLPREREVGENGAAWGSESASAESRCSRHHREAPPHRGDWPSKFEMGSRHADLSAKLPKNLPNG